MIETEGISEVIVQLGGQTALNLAKQLEAVRCEDPWYEFKDN